MEPSSSARPASVAAAAALLGVFGIAVTVNALLAQGFSGWTEVANIPRALLRLAGAGVVAWGLWRGASWAWWLGLALAILWLIGGLAPVLVVEQGDMHWLPPSRGQLVLAVSLVSLVCVIGLLLTPSARAYLRPRR